MGPPRYDEAGPGSNKGIKSEGPCKNNSTVMRSTGLSSLSNFDPICHSSDSTGWVDVFSVPEEDAYVVHRECSKIPCSFGTGPVHQSRKVVNANFAAATLLHRIEGV